MIAFAPAAQGSPATSEAALLLLDHLFALGYRRVEWKCNALNARSVAAAARLGFSAEGVFRKHLIVAGVAGAAHSRDTAWFSLLDDEWPAARVAVAGWLASDAAAAKARWLAIQ